MSDSPLISICIPVYNSDVNSLAQSLYEQCKLLGDKVEIIVIDDCSDRIWKQKNEASKNVCKFIELPENIGRSKIRNLFLAYSKGDYLLFIDGDSEIVSKNYVFDFVRFLENSTVDVLVGGSIYQIDKPDRSKYLRWKYSIYRESKTADKREKGNLGFKTNNFLIRRELFLEIPFNEELKGYGHEDTLFGILLIQKNCKIEHLENPVLNKHLDTNKVFLKKTDNAILNLVKIYFMRDQYPEISEIKLIRFYEKIAQQKLRKIVLIIFQMIRPFVVFFLQKGCFTLWMFDFYKLGLFIRKIKS